MHNVYRSNRETAFTFTTIKVIRHVELLRFDAHGYYEEWHDQVGNIYIPLHLATMTIYVVGTLQTVQYQLVAAFKFIA